MYLKLIKHDLKRLLNDRIIHVAFVLYVALGLMPLATNFDDAFKYGSIINNAGLLSDNIIFSNSLVIYILIFFALYLSFGTDFEKSSNPDIFVEYPDNKKLILFRILNITAVLAVVQLFNYLVNITSFNIAIDKVDSNQAKLHFFDSRFIKIYLIQIFTIFIITTISVCVLIIVKNMYKAFTIISFYFIFEYFILHALVNTFSKIAYVPFNSLKTLQVYSYFDNSEVIDYLVAMFTPLLLALILVFFAIKNLESKKV